MTINYRRLFLLAGITSLSLCYALLWARMITTPAEYTGADFIAFYAAGRIAQGEGPAHAYDLGLIQHYEQNVVGFPIDPTSISPFLHPPFLLPLLRLVALPNYVLAFILWNLIMLVFLGLGAALLMHDGLSATSPTQTKILLVGILLFFPTFLGLVTGQDNAILYLGAVAWMLGVLKKRDWLAGSGLALMTIRPHLALPLAILFLFRRRQVWWWFLLGIALLAIVSLAYAGWGGISGFLQVILVSSVGQNYHTGENHMFNVIGILLRLFPSLALPLTNGIGWGVYLLAIMGMVVWWIRIPQVEGKHLSLAVVLTLLTSPHTHVNDLILLIIPLVTLLAVMRDEKYGQERNLVFVPLAVSFSLLIGFFSDVVKYSLTYLVMVGLLLPLWFPGRFFRPSISPQNGTP
jgi:hypothetical protein